MKLETLARRIAEKAGAPALEDAILQGTLPDEMGCMVWTGKKTRSGLFPRMVRDSEGRPGYEPSLHKPSPLIQYEKKDHYVNRLVFSKTRNQDLSNVKLSNICGDTLCVNPLHWVVPLKTEELIEEEDLPEISEEWTLEDALELLEIYLETNQKIDPEHALLIDIPAELLEKAITHIRGG